MSPLAKEWLAKGLADLATAEREMRVRKKPNLAPPYQGTGVSRPPQASPFPCPWRWKTLDSPKTSHAP
jgi:hypothetical protein